MAPAVKSAGARAADEPRIDGAALAAGHDGFPELVLRIRFENGALADVIGPLQQEWQAEQLASLE